MTSSKRRLRKERTARPTNVEMIIERNNKQREVENTLVVKSGDGNPLFMVRGDQ